MPRRIIKSRKMRALFSIFAISFFAQLAFGQQFVRKQEAAIYAHVIRDVRRLEGDWAGKTRRLLVLASTIKGDGELLGKDSRQTIGLLRDFERANQQSLKLPASFSEQCKCDLLSEAELKELLDRGTKESERREAAAMAQGKALPPDCDSDWKYFHNKFPKVNQYYEISRIGYSADHKFAFVETKGTGSCSDVAWTHLLKRTRHGWKIYQIGGIGRGVI